MTRNPMLLKLRLVFSFLLLAATVAVVWHFGRRPKPTAALGQAGLWVVSDTVTLRGDAEPLTSSAVWDGTSIKLAGSRNEVVAWQVAARVAEAVAQASLKLAPFRSGEQSLPGGAVALFREHYLEVTAPSQLSSTEPVPHGLGPGWYPCQAVPLKVGEAVEVPAGRVAAFWVDVTIPADARPGLYTSSLEVTAGSQRATWPVQLEVLPLSMPRETHFTNWFYYGPEMLAEFYQTQNDAELMAYEQVYQQLAHDHRMTLATEPMLGDGRFNWSAWWARYGGYLDGSAFTRGPGRGAGATCWPIGLSHEATPEDFAAACRSAVAFFKGRGLLEKVFTCIWDEPGDQQAYKRIRELGKRVDQAVGNRLPVMVTEQLQPQEPAWGSLLPAVDIFCSASSSDADMALIKQRGGDVWVYNGGLAGGPYLDVPLAGVAAWGPAAWRFELGGWYLWDSLYWRQHHYDLKQPTDLYRDPLTFDETRRLRDGKPYPADWAIRLNGDGVMLYPGEPVGLAGPVASLRMKAFRRGAQDYEYLYLLRQKGHRAAADAFARQLSTGRGTWAEDPATWIQVRRDMAELLRGKKTS